MQNHVSDATAAAVANITRIEGLIDWKQPLTETDKKEYAYYLLAKWEASKTALEVAKADEMEWRRKIVAFAFNPEKKSGTERIDLENGYQAKAVKKLNYGFVKREADGKLDKAAVDAALTAIETMHPAGAYIAENLVKWTPELSLTEYKKLVGDLAPLKAVIDKVIVTTDGAPTLEIVAPKGA